MLRICPRLTVDLQHMLACGRSVKCNRIYLGEKVRHISDVFLSRKTNQFTTSTNPIIHLFNLPKILHNYCLQVLLGHHHVPRELANNDYAKFLGGKRGVL